MYEVFEHTADLGLRVRAAALNELFADAARGLFSMMVANLDTVQPLEVRKYNIKADGLDYLLFDWLSELLYTFETDRLLLAEFNVRVETNRLEATARGEAMDIGRHEMDHEVKAITYHELKVCQSPDGWLAEVIVDI